MISNTMLKGPLLMRPLLLLLLLCFSVLSFAQNNLQTIRGTITLSRSSDEPAGTSVNIKGKLEATVTNNEGAFSLSARLPVTLVISRVGYGSLEVRVTDTTLVKVLLTEGNNNMNEVVVVSYGTRLAKDITSAVSTFNASRAKEIPAAEFGQKLQGRVAGVQISMANGRPGQGIDMRIRGAATLGGGYQPLIVVDGQILSGADTRNGDMNLINPDDIETFTVLKDAAAAALYGSRAGNGVILITTKQAKVGRTNITFDTYYGWQKVPQKGRPDIMNAHEFAAFMKGYYEDKIKYEGYTKGIPEDYATPDQYGEGTNWYNALLRTAPMQNYSLNLSSGTEKLSSSSTLSYFNQDGVLLNTNLQRFSFRSNNEYRPGDRFKIGLNLAPTYQAEKNTRNYTDGNRQIIANATAASPLKPVYNADGTFNTNASSYGMLNLNNPVQQLLLADSRYKTLRLLGNAYADIAILKNLHFKTTINGDLASVQQDSYQGTMYGIGLGASPLPRPPSNSTAVHVSYDYVSWLNENTLNYNLSLNDHHLDVMAGYSAQKWSREYRNINGSNFANDEIYWISGAAVTNGSTNKEAWTMASSFGRLNYDYKGKYLLTATFRRDGSSRFGPTVKYADFPSVSAGWVISDEGFFKKNNVVSFLKIRGSYGKTGNFNIGYYTMVTNINASNYVFGGNLTPGFVPGPTLGNPQVTWEPSAQTDIGADINFLKNRIIFSYDYYSKTTTDMLYPVNLPYESGFSNIQMNVAKLRMWGHDFSVSSRNLTGAFEWTTDVNVSLMRNKLLSLPPNTEFIGNNTTYAGYNRSVVGKSIGQFYGYVFDGIYMNQAELDSAPKHTTSTVGSVRMKDINEDGVINADDRTLIGDPNPKYNYGITNTFRYRNFDLAIVCYGQGGNKILNTNRADWTNLDGVMNVASDMMYRWRSEADPGNGKVPGTRSGTTELYRLANSSWVENGNFFTIKNIALGYTFRENLVKYVKAARIYASVQQVAVFTHYSGMNPEANATKDNLTGIYGQDLSTFPIPRTFTIGANFSF
ncbi:SusC/RagA family TonB-linked outer membrane protein [Niabella ginsenosidivorans]|uniref:SusC/RagA family TonB-linked outer membrane protein n=1 Tax=Niabella ginsenosidivorans TaxID=1176587 RepID=A0A1A9I6L3_9BACT|nr:TonB-dependent receptor [Niabella ginsenosidivorans]ANH83256.1 SusC/RagA family TonB-linked outer membrane protein [Niabella ginsenosidivorans]